MYRIDDTIASLKEVQRLLGINQTGVFDNRTRKAVADIQGKYSLDASDTVDYTTFNYIVKEYRRKKLQDKKTDYLFSAEFPYVINDIDPNVELINGALRYVLEDYTYEGIMPSGRFLGINTIDAANFLRQVFILPLSDQIDREFVNRLLIEKQAIEAKRKLS